MIEPSGTRTLDTLIKRQGVCLSEHLRLLSFSSPPFSLPPLLCGWQRWARAAARLFFGTATISLFASDGSRGYAVKHVSNSMGGSHEHIARL